MFIKPTFLLTSLGLQFTSLLTADDAINFTADADNDGLTYRQEQLIGTNPFPLYDTLLIIDLEHEDFWASPTAIDNDGLVSGQLSEPFQGYTIGFIWSSSSGFTGYSVVDPSDALAGQTVSNNNHTSYAVSESDGYKATLVTTSAGSYTLSEAGTDVMAKGLNSTGQIVGQSDGNAFYWFDGQLLDLNDLLAGQTGWHLDNAVGINNHGEITGTATFEDSNYGYVIIPVGIDDDGDGLPNDWETYYGYDPENADSDGNGILDGFEDPDGDGLNNLEEFEKRQLPLAVAPYENLQIEKVFVSSSYGRDTNDGLSILSPKETIQNSSSLAEFLMQQNGGTIQLELEEGTYTADKLGVTNGKLIIKPRGKVIITSE